MAAVPAPLQSAILAVLRAAKDAGYGQLSRTALFKLVYLLDCLHAEGHGGETASGSAWYFHHYGPFAVDLANGIDELAARGIIQSRAGEKKNKDFWLYWLGEYPLGPSLAEVGLPSALAARFGVLVRKFSGDLSALLNHTYFLTLPMREAVPGKRIDFSSLKGLDQIRSHQHTSVTDHAKLLKIATLAESLANKYSGDAGNARAMAAHRPIYDRAFANAMAEIGGEDLEADSIAFKAQLA